MVFIALLISVLPAFAGAVLVPTAPIPADGETTSTVRVYIDNAEGARVRVKSDGGKAGPSAVGSDGIVAFPFTPAAVTAPKTVSLKVTVSGDDFMVDLPVVPKLAGSLAVAFDPPVASAAATTMVKITPSGTTPVAAGARRLVVTASAGTVDVVAPAGDGTYIARYTPPAKMTAPLNVTFVVSDAAAPEIQGYGVLPVTLKRSLTFDAAAGSNNVLVAGGKQFGPFVAAPSGKVAFDIEVDPRVQTGQLTTVMPDTSRSQKNVPIPGIATTPQVLILPLPSVIPADGTLKVPVRVATIGPDGELTSGAGLKLSASGGSISPPVADGKEQSASWTPPTTAGSVTLTAEFNGVKATKTVKVVTSLPTVTLTTEPYEISKSGSSFKVLARVKDAAGMGIVGKAPTFVAEGASASGSVKDNKDGSYTASFSVSSKVNRARVMAIPAVDASGSAPVRILAWPSSATLLANGTDSTSLTIVAVDALDLPVANTEFKLGVPKGDGGVPLSVKSDAHGVARVTYKSGTAAGLVDIRIEAAGLMTDVPLFQTKGASAVPSPAGGTAWEASLNRWKMAVPAIKIDREGSIPPSGPPSMVQVSAVPPYTTPGAAILVQVRVADATGGGVGGQKLEVTSAPAVPGTVTDNRDGTYNVPVQLPAGVDGPVTVIVKAGGATGSVVLQTLAEAGPIAKAGPTGGGPKTPKAGGGFKQSGGMARMRVSAGLTDAHGGLEMDVDGSDLPEGVAFNSPGAGFWGAAAQGQYWVVNADFGGIGADVRAGTVVELFNVGGNGYGHVGHDLILGARYRKPFGPFSVQGALAYHSTQAPAFTYSDETRVDAALIAVPVMGVRVGGLAVLELGRVYLSLEAAETFAPHPAVTHFDLYGDVMITDAIGVRIGVADDLRWVKFDEGNADADVMSNYVIANAGVVLRMD